MDLRWWYHFHYQHTPVKVFGWMALYNVGNDKDWYHHPIRNYNYGLLALHKLWYRYILYHPVMRNAMNLWWWYQFHYQHTPVKVFSWIVLYNVGNDKDWCHHPIRNLQSNFLQHYLVCNFYQWEIH